MKINSISSILFKNSGLGKNKNVNKDAKNIIEETLYKIIATPELNADLNSISVQTNLPLNVVKKTIFDLDNWQLYNLYRRAIELKRSIKNSQDTNNVKLPNDPFYIKKDRLLANSMVRDAVNNNKKKLDYKNISLATGMSRDEINQILFHYAVSLHNQIEYIENKF